MSCLILMGIVVTVFEVSLMTVNLLLGFFSLLVCFENTKENFSLMHHQISRIAYEADSSF